MKSIASVLSIMALGFGLLGCPGGGGGSTSAFAVSTTAADFGVVGNAYTSTLAATGGTAPFTWTLSGGVLPTGSPPFSLNPGTGVVNGIPTAAGNFTATFTVTDSTGQTATGSVLFAIHPRTDRVSVDSNGTAGNGVSSSPSIDSTGRLVAFASLATNLLGPSGPTISGQQIYLHDWQTNQASLISKNGTAGVLTGGNGVSSAPSVSGDGNLIAFVSSAPDLLPAGSPVVSGQQIYFHNGVTGQTSLVSKDNGVPAAQGNGLSDTPSINSDATNASGGFVAFMSLSGNLPSGGGQHVYARAIP